MHPRSNTMEFVDKDEIKLAEFKKHPMGIVLIYIQAFFGFVVGLGLIFFLLPSVLGDQEDAFYYANLFAAITILLAVIIISVATFIYIQNRIIVTDRSITQVLQQGLFSRKVSQLNMNNVEDVTVVQDGFLPTTFNYGLLKIETAGEQANFHFTYCPHPSYHAKIILDAREKALGQVAPDQVA
jgi:uncharacterized membrane protein YdbT with pleckstrin-like domain